MNQRRTLLAFAGILFIGGLFLMVALLALTLACP